MKQFLSVNDVPDISSLVKLAQRIKAKPQAYAKVGKGKSIAMLFFNSSLRTRLSTDMAAAKLGMHRVTMNVNSDSWGLEFEDRAVMDGNTAEHIKEAAPVIGNYADILAVRSFPALENREDDYAEKVMNAFSTYSGKPLLSMESATLHPLQALADVMTINELFPTKKKLKVALRWAPHPKKLPQAVPNSFAQWMNKMEDVDLRIVQPEGFELHPDFAGDATLSYDPHAGIQNADIVYVKNWSAYNDYGKTAPALKNWTLNQEAMAHCPDAKVMHCLPVRRNVVIADEVLDSSNSAVIQQAENRLWSAAAVLHEMIGALR